MRRAVSVALVVGVAIAAGGCGYTMTSSLDPRYQTVYVTAFQNQSREYDLQAPLTNAIIRKFINDGRLRVVGPSEADLIVSGTILDYSLEGLAFDDDDDVSQFQTFVVASARVVDARTGNVVWEDGRVVGETSFVSSNTNSSSDRLRGNAQSFIPTVRSFQTDEENQAASEALERVATEIFYRTIEPW